MDDNARIVERAEEKYHEAITWAVVTEDTESHEALLLGWILGKDRSKVREDIAKAKARREPE